MQYFEKKSRRKIYHVEGRLEKEEEEKYRREALL